MAALVEEPGHRLDDFPHLKGWFDGIAARPAVQRGVEVLAGLRKPLADDKAREILFGATQYQRRCVGTRARSASHTVASESLGARQSPRGESDPPEPTLGAFGTHERLNWLVLKKRNRKVPRCFLISASEYSLRATSGPSGQTPCVRSCHAV